MAVTQTVADLDLAQVDLMDPRWFADGPPHELFARMRQEAPVRWNPLPGGRGFWSLTRHEDISEVSRNPQIFSSARKGVFLEPDVVLPLDVLHNLLLYMDPPRHTKYRSLLQSAFTPHTVAKLEEGVRARISQLVDAVASEGRCDFVQDIAVPSPLGVLADLMGLPAEDIPRLHEWTDRIEEAQRASEIIPETFGEMAAYLHEQIARQIEAGDDDSLVMRLRTAEVDGARLDDSEILVFFGLLVFAGNDTTRNTSAQGMLTLLENPDELQKLVDEPRLIPSAVEEILRYTSVVMWFARTATEDTELAGQRIAQDDHVVMWYSSASRDEALFEDPDRFDVTRGSKEHKAFGGGGRHFCLGAGLARLELRVIFEEVTQRLGNLRLDGEPTRLGSNWANALLSLPVAFDPQPRP